jgi:hypothetical protein
MNNNDMPDSTISAELKNDRDTDDREEYPEQDPMDLAKEDEAFKHVARNIDNDRMASIHASIIRGDYAQAIRTTAIHAHDAYLNSMGLSDGE